MPGPIIIKLIIGTIINMVLKMFRIAQNICYYLLNLAIRVTLSPFSFAICYDQLIATVVQYYRRFVGVFEENYPFSECYRIFAYLCNESITRIFSESRESCQTEDIRNNINYVVITDGSSDYGRDIARVMSESGAQVIVGDRTHTGDVQSRDNVCTIHLNMVSLVSVRAFALHVFHLTSGHPIDILILNACYLSDTDTRQVTDIFERHFAANHLGNMIIIKHLFDRLKASANARVVIESSANHVFGNIHFNDINLSMNYTTMRAYFQSKLANVLLAHSIAQQTNHTISAYSVNPGCSESEIEWRHKTGLPAIISLIYQMFNLVCNRSQYSIHTTLFCALDASVARHSGGYYSNCRRIKTNICDDTANQLWDLSCDMLGIPRNILRIQPNGN